MNKAYSLLAIAALLITSCTIELVEPDQVTPKGETVTIVANVSETKTTHSDRIFSWEAGEVISVGTSESAYVDFDVDNASEGTFKHTFGGVAPSLLMAVSPAQTGVSFTSAINYEVKLPATYNNYVPGTTNALMIGTPDGVTPNKFNFSHSGALLKITYANVPVGTTAFVIEASENITGTVSLTGTDVSDIEIANDNVGLTGAKVQLNLKNEVTAVNSTLTFCVPVPTGAYDMLEIYLKTSDGKIAATDKTMSKTLTLERGDVFVFPTITLPVATVLTENFYSSGASNNNYDCNSSLSTASNRSSFEYTWTGGTGTVFTNGIKLGSSGATGTTTSSNFISGIATGKIFTVKVYAAVWNTDGGKIKVSYNGDDTILDASNDPITSTSGEYSSSAFANPTLFTFAKVDGENDLSISSSAKRLLVDKVEVVYGIVEQLPQVATPYFSETEGEVPYETSLTISCDTGGASIYYTTDGTTPDTTNPAQLYSGAIPITGTVTIKAVAVKEDYRNSGMASATFTVPQVETPSISLSSNVITLSCDTDGATIKYTTDGSEPSTSNGTTYSSTIAVDPSDDYTLKVKAFKSGMKPSELATMAIVYDDGSSVVDPSFSLANTSPVEYTSNVTISSETAGSTIYYTTDGSNPTSSSAHGTAGTATVTIPVANTIKAIAIKGGSSSEVVTKVYSITATFTNSSAGGMTSSGAAQEGSKGSVTINISNGAADGTAIKVYKGQTISFSVPSGKVIKKVVLTCTASGTSKYGPGCLSFASGTGSYSYSGTAGTWTGSLQSFTSNSTSEQVRATQIVVTYQDAD